MRSFRPYFSLGKCFLALAGSAILAFGLYNVHSFSNVTEGGVLGMTLLQWLAQAIPLTHFLVIVQGSFLKALPLSDILASLWPLAIIALVSLTMATVFVRGRLQ